MKAPGIYPETQISELNVELTVSKIVTRFSPSCGPQGDNLGKNWENYSEPILVLCNTSNKTVHSGTNTVCNNFTTLATSLRTEPIIINFSEVINGHLSNSMKESFSLVLATLTRNQTNWYWYGIKIAAFTFVKIKLLQHTSWCWYSTKKILVLYKTDQ